MSDVAHPHSPMRVRVRPSRLSVLIVTLLVICATVVGVILLTSGDSHSSSPSAVQSSQTSGPNEAARGQAAATAAGAQPSQTGGPNETARGQSAASASRP